MLLPYFQLRENVPVAYHRNTARIQRTGYCIIRIWSKQVHWKEVWFWRRLLFSTGYYHPIWLLLPGRWTRKPSKVLRICRSGRSSLGWRIHKLDLCFFQKSINSTKIYSDFWEDIERTLFILNLSLVDYELIYFAFFI